MPATNHFLQLVLLLCLSCLASTTPQRGFLASKKRLSIKNEKKRPPSISFSRNHYNSEAFLFLLCQLDDGLGNILGAKPDQFAQAQLAAVLHKAVGQSQSFDFLPMHEAVICIELQHC